MTSNHAALPAPNFASNMISYREQLRKLLQQDEIRVTKPRGRCAPTHVQSSRVAALNPAEGAKLNPEPQH
jgi:hypothetical protein